MRAPSDYQAHAALGACRRAELDLVLLLAEL